MNILIKNTNIIDENKNIQGDIYIENGIIKEIGVNLEKSCKTINGENLITMPSFIDLHVHLREPGFTDKEDIESGSLSALKGGFTLVNAMGNTKPIASNMEVVDYVLDKSRKLDLIDIHQTVSITNNFDGEALDHLDLIDKDKVTFISDDGHGVISNIIMYKAMVKAQKLGFTIMTHAEDINLTAIDYRISENIITFRDLYLSSVTSAKLHLSHVSTKEALEGIRIAKKTNPNVTCEVSPHHIALFDNDYKVNPPIREYEDVLSVIEAIKDNTIDAIATDHAPHTLLDKENKAPGMIGLELAFPIVYTYLSKYDINLNTISKLMSANPARIFNRNCGKIEIGYQGNLVIIDKNKKFTVNPNDFVSKGKNTPFIGEELTGVIAATIKSGDLKYHNKDYNLLF